MRSECDVPVPGIFHFFGGIGTGIDENWYRIKVLEYFLAVKKKISPMLKIMNIMTRIMIIITMIMIISCRGCESVPDRGKADCRYHC